jgi:hypothetical protein
MADMRPLADKGVGRRFLHKASLPIRLRGIDWLIKVQKDRTGARGKDLELDTGKVDCELKRLKRIDSDDRSNCDLGANGKAHRTPPVHAVCHRNVLDGFTELHSHTILFAGIAACERSLGNCPCVVAKSRRKIFEAHDSQLILLESSPWRPSGSGRTASFGAPQRAPPQAQIPLVQTRSCAFSQEHRSVFHTDTIAHKLRVSPSVVVNEA